MSAGTTVSDLRLALVSLAAEDTGAGGLVALVGRARPLQIEGAQRQVDFPVLTYFFVDAGEAGTMEGKQDHEVQFTVWVSPDKNPTYIENGEAIRKRVVDLFTQPNLLTKSVDARPANPRWRDLPADADGVMGLVLEMAFTNAE